MKVETAGTRVLTQPAAKALVERLRADGRRIVFTNGVYDLLHPGHIRYLQQARLLGDALIVGVNADVSVRRLKGPARPINPERERAELVAALDCVDAAVIFEEDTPAEIVRLVRPHILVKGADWPADQIVGRDTVEAHGGQVVLAKVAPGFSTTALIEKIRSL